jgi:hypothetical protein
MRRRRATGRRQEERPGIVRRPGLRGSAADAVATNADNRARTLFGIRDCRKGSERADE